MRDSNIEKEKLSRDLETSMFDALREVKLSGAASKYRTELCFDTVDDTKKGTDMFIDGLRIDVTYNFEGKDHMAEQFTRKAVDIQFAGRMVSFYVGVRYGNKHRGFTKFKEPVAVIGFTEEDCNFLRDWILPNIESRVGKVRNLILDAVQDVLFEYEEAQEV